MSRRLRFILGAVGVALVGAGAGWWAGQAWYGIGRLADTPPGRAERFIDATFNDIHGKRRQLSEWAGRPIVLNFWATWCPPCREEIPLFVELQHRYGNTVQFIGIALEDPEPVAEFARRYGINYPILVGPGADAFALMDRYGNPHNALPFTVVMAADGRIVERRAGAYRRNSLEKLLQGTLGGAPLKSP